MTRAMGAAAVCLLAACGERATETLPERGAVALSVHASGSGRVLDSGRVHLDGPTPRILGATPGSSVTIQELQPGTYSITLEGFAGDEVERFGRTSGVQVVAGETEAVTVSLDLFQPALAPVGLCDDGGSIVITFPVLAGADSYRVEVDSTLAFATPRTETVTGTTVSFPVLWLGPQLVRARAFDIYDVPGVLTAPKQSTVSRLVTLGDFDGYVLNSGDVSTVENFTFVGDDLSGLVARSFFGFDLSPIAPGEVVNGAVLRLFQAAMDGDPYGTLGNMTLDHVDFGPALDPADYVLLPLTPDIGAVSTTPALEFKIIVVTDEVRRDQDEGRTISQFRVRFSQDSDGDGASDFVTVYTAEKLDTVPELLVVSE